MRPVATVLLVTFALLTMGQEGCDTDSRGVGGAGNGDGSLDATPEKLDGSSSQEFESDDIDRAESAPESVQDYCAGAVSEAQRIGCLSHVDPSEVP